MKERPRKYGNKRTWEHAIDAVEARGGRATVAEVREFLTSHFPNYNPANAGADLDTCSVNCESRGAYTAVNGAPRRTDMQHPGDKLYKHGHRKDVFYEIYRPARHGVWELYEAGTRYLAVRRALNATE